MMKKLKSFILSPVVTVVAFVLAAGLLLFSSVGGARAALTYFSETYASRVGLSDIGITLMENGKEVSWRNYGESADGQWDESTGALLGKMLAKGEKIALGKPYTEELSVRNSGSINQYVRVSIYKYWVDENGDKRQDLDPAYIDLRLVNLGTDWIEDESARTRERTVLYYTHRLDSGKTSPLFADRLSINGKIARIATQTTGEDGSVVTVFEYNGAKFVIEAKVDAVQENNANAAVLSAWGVQLSIDEETGTLSLDQGGV